MAEKPTAPEPKATPESEPYWQGLQRGELMLPFCNPCAALFYYPRGVCPRCLSSDLSWQRVSGRGRLHTFTINYRPSRGHGSEPIVIGIVALEEGPRLMSRIVGVAADPSRLGCDIPVELTIAAAGAGASLPAFRPVAAGASVESVDNAG